MKTGEGAWKQEHHPDFTARSIIAPVINILVDCSQWQSSTFASAGNLGAFAVLPKGFIGPFSGRPILSGWVIGC